MALQTKNKEKGMKMEKKRKKKEVVEEEGEKMNKCFANYHS